MYDDDGSFDLYNVLYFLIVGTITAGAFVVVAVSFVCLFASVFAILWAPILLILAFLAVCLDKRVKIRDWAIISVACVVFFLFSLILWGGYLHRMTDPVQPLCDMLKVTVKNGTMVSLTNESTSNTIDHADLWVLGGELGQFDKVYPTKTVSYEYQSSPFFLGIMYLHGTVKAISAEGLCLYRQ